MRYIPAVAAMLALPGLMALVFGGSAMAAKTPATEPGRIERRLETPTPAAPVEAPAPIVPPTREEPAPEEPEKAITLTGVVIIGATVYPPEALAPLYEDFLGQEILPADIEKILAAITRKYREEGYVLTRAVAPLQGAEFGVLRIRVLEGYVDRVVFTGDMRGRQSLLDAYSRRITAQRPMTLSVLERYVLLMGDLPGAKVRPSLRELDGDAAAYLLEVAIEHDWVEAFASLDNRGTRSIGPLQALVGANINSALGLFERTRVRFFTVPDDPRELIFADLHHEETVGSDGTRLLLSGSHSDIEAVSRFDGTAFEGDSTRFVIGLSHPFIRARERGLTVSGKFDFLDAEQAAVDDSFEDRLRVLRLSARYSIVNAAGGSSVVTVEASQGLNILGATKSGSAGLSRTSGRSDFTKITGFLSHTQRLYDGFSLRLASTAQASTSTLLSSEEMSLGGGQFARAYDPSEVTGDDGAAGLVEFAYKGSIGGAIGKYLLRSYRVFGFYELGAVWTTDTGRESVASAGVGLGLEFSRGVQATAEWAAPLTRPVAAEGDNGGRVFFRLASTF